MCRKPDPFLLPLHFSPFFIGQRRSVNGAQSVGGGARGAHVQVLHKTFVVPLTTHVRGSCDEVVDAIVRVPTPAAFLSTLFSGVRLFMLQLDGQI